MCDVLCTTTHCNTLQHTVTQRHTATYYITVLQEGGEARYCNTLQRTATHCSTATLQRTTLLCSKKAARRCTATHCNALQHTATHCNVLHYSAPRRRRGAVLQRVKSRMEYPETPYREAPIPLPSGVNLTRPKPGPSTAS